jgi:hypothetical protein
MKLITERAVVTCGHQGVVVNVPAQRWVRIDSSPVLADDDPERRSIVGCPNYGPTIKPCTTTLKVISGYSTWLTIDGRRIAMSHLDGLTDGTVPGTVHYTVPRPGQGFVEGDG